MKGVPFLWKMVYLTIISWAQMGSESMAHKAEGQMQARIQDFEMGGEFL